MRSWNNSFYDRAVLYRVDGGREGRKEIDKRGEATTNNAGPRVQTDIDFENLSILSCAATATGNPGRAVLLGEAIERGGRKTKPNEVNFPNL